LATSADLLLDTSAAVSFLLASHAAHGSTYAAIAGRRLGLAGHAAFETFAVITRLPEPTRVSPVSAARLLRHNFPVTRYLSTERTASLIDEWAGSAVSGGAVYDALVAAAAVEHGCVLATRDQRALGTYATLGTRVMLLD
jgi:predicted nucleic acid-binding protein